MPKNNDIWIFPGKLIRAVDGDTADMELDLGLRHYTRDRFRLLGVDTPERGKPGYQEAKDFLQTLKGLDLIVHTNRTGKYGRWLATIFAGDSKVPINKIIIEAGLGVEYKK